MKKKYYINVWECLFYKVDEDGNELRDDNGNVILYEAPKLDYSSNSEFVEDDDLIVSKFKWEDKNKKEPEKPKTTQEYFNECLTRWSRHVKR